MAYGVLMKTSLPVTILSAFQNGGSAMAMKTVRMEAMKRTATAVRVLFAVCKFIFTAISLYFLPELWNLVTSIMIFV